MGLLIDTDFGDAAGVDAVVSGRIGEEGEGTLKNTALGFESVEIGLQHFTGGFVFIARAAFGFLLQGLFGLVDGILNALQGGVQFIFEGVNDFGFGRHLGQKYHRRLYFGCAHGKIW